MTRLIWFNALGWLLAGIFLGRYLITRKRLNAIRHDLVLIKLFLSTGGQL